jgi:peroxisomal 3,2-trans-enoyl-CoA isomerase
VKFIILSGNGGNFSSGNDLQNFGNPQFTSLGSTEQMSRATAEMLSDLNEAIILSKKPIFAITEGKVIGFAFTQLLLYDRVFSVASSEFNAPLVKLAQGPEMCASYTFPKVFGRNVGEDLLVKGTKVDSSFLEKYGVVTSVKTRAEAEFALNIHLEDLDSLDWVSYLNARKLFRDLDRATLLKANAKEVDNLVDRWCNPELPRLLMEYMSKVKLRSKL